MVLAASMCSIAGVGAVGIGIDSAVAVVDLEMDYLVTKDWSKRHELHDASRALHV